MTEESFEPEIDPNLSEFSQFLYANGFFVACSDYDTEEDGSKGEPQVTILDITGNTIEESLKLRLLLETAGFKIVPDPEDETALKIGEACILVAYDAGDDLPPQILVFGIDDAIFNKIRKKAKLRLLN